MIAEQLVRYGEIVAQRGPGWIMLASGRPFWPLNPDPADITIDDIATGLAHQNRFGGHAGTYTVAQHSWLVSFAVPYELALWGLLHDASEGLGLLDLPRPVKHHPSMASYREAEKRLMAAVCERFCLPTREPDGGQGRGPSHAPHRAAGSDAASDPGEGRTDVEPYPFHIEPWGPNRAKREFLARFAAITGRE